MRVAVLSSVVLAGCVHTRNVIIEAQRHGAPVSGATIAAVCKPAGSGAGVSSASGIVSLAIRDKADRCTITVSDHEGTARRDDVGTCAANATCPVVTVELP